MINLDEAQLEPRERRTVPPQIAWGIVLAYVPEDGNPVRTSPDGSRTWLGFRFKLLTGAYAGATVLWNLTLEQKNASGKVGNELWRARAILEAHKALLDESVPMKFADANELAATLHGRLAAANITQVTRTGRDGVTRTYNNLWFLSPSMPGGLSETNWGKALDLAKSEGVRNAYALQQIPPFGGTRADAASDNVALATDIPWLRG
jgi:hypothetical protein